MIWFLLRVSIAVLSFMHWHGGFSRAQDINWNEFSEAKASLLSRESAFLKGLSANTLNFDLIVTLSNGQTTTKKVEILRDHEKSLVRVDETHDQGTKTRIRIYKRPWYIELGRNNDEPYTLRSYVLYDDMPEVEARRSHDVDSVVEAPRRTGGVTISELLSGRNGWAFSGTKRQSENDIIATFTNAGHRGYLDRIELTLSDSFGLAITKALLFFARPADWQGPWDKMATEENTYTVRDEKVVLTERRVVEQNGRINLYKNIVTEKGIDPQKFELSYYGLSDLKSPGERTWLIWAVVVVLGLACVLVGTLIRNRSRNGI